MQIMETTAAQKKAFGSRLREQREGLELTLKELVDRLAEHEITTSVSTVSGWERGESSPRDRKIVRLLDSLLRCEGELASALDVTMARPSGATLSLGEGREVPDVDLGPLVLRRLRGGELTDAEEEALGHLDTIKDGRYAVESAVFALAREVGDLIVVINAMADHIGWIPADLMKLRNELAHGTKLKQPTVTRIATTIDGRTGLYEVSSDADDADIALKKLLDEAASSGEPREHDEPTTSQRPVGSVPEEPEGP